MAKPLLNISDEVGVPKYQQIIDGITCAINQKELRLGEPLPSMTKLCADYKISRDTANKAYNELKSLGIIQSVSRKGYYVATEEVSHSKKIFLLTDEFNAYQKVLYDSILKAVDHEAIVDIYFHHNNPKVFKTLITNNLDAYNMFLIKPFDDKSVTTVLSAIKNSPLLLIDRNEYAGENSFIAQNFNSSVITCLESRIELFKKYNKFNLVFRPKSYHPHEIKYGFNLFSSKHSIDSEILDSLKEREIRKGEVYFVIDDEDLVTVIEMAKAKNLEIGKEIGIISYNDTPVKRVIGNGITVISADWQLMAKRIAQFAREPKQIQITVPTTFIIRSSL